MTKNATGYTAQKISSTATTHHTSAPPTFGELGEYIHDGWIILWQHHKVFIVPVNHGTCQPPDDMESDFGQHLQKAVAFNPQKEWKVMAGTGGFKHRRREDSAAATVNAVTVVNTEAKLRGTFVHQLPDSSSQETWVVGTRNYITHNNYHLAGYTDSRFLYITKAGKESQS